MRVLVLQALAGNGKPYPVQSGEQELPDAFAKDLISRGLAQPVPAEQRSEKATLTSKKPPQKRTKKKTGK